MYADMERSVTYGRHGHDSARRLPAQRASSSTTRHWHWLCGLLILLSSVSTEALSGPRWWDKHEWTKDDMTFQVGYTLLHIVDWGQTLDIENHPRHFERNPILGRHPSRSEVHTYFATTLGLHWLIARALPRKWRNHFQASTIAIQFGVVKDNFEGGISIDF